MVAAEKPAVRTPIHTVKGLEFENIILADPDTALFSSGTDQASHLGSVECSAGEQSY